LNKVKNKIYKLFLVFLGSLSLVMGIIGIFVPVWPTTVFLLISAWAYSKSNEKFYNWLISNKYFGEYIRNYREKRGLPVKIKVRTTLFLWITILISVYLVNIVWLKLLLIVIAISVSLHVWMLKTFREESN
jgi:uncharacterized membrane protein YbaN (DUF454 family)